MIWWVNDEWYIISEQHEHSCSKYINESNLSFKVLRVYLIKIGVDLNFRFNPCIAQYVVIINENAIVHMAHHSFNDKNAYLAFCSCNNIQVSDKAIKSVWFDFYSFFPMKMK